MHKILKIGICNKSEFETEIIKQNILHLNNVKIIWTSLDTHSSILMLHDNIPDILLLDTNVGSQQLIETINITKSVYTKVIITST